MALNRKTGRPRIVIGEDPVKIEDRGSTILIRRGKQIPRNNKTQDASTLGANDFIFAALERGRKAWKQYRANREYDRDAVYIYLDAVFDIVQQWKKKELADKYSLQALKQHGFRSKIKADPFARVIYCTSAEDDPRKRSKWAKVMQWVARYNKKGRSFSEFVKNNGGLNEAANLAADNFTPNWT